MGRDKALIEVAGEPLLLRAVRALALPVRAVGVSVDGAERAERYRAVLAGAGMAAVFHLDREPDRGPLEGVRSSLLELPGPRAFFLAVDAPLVPPELVELLEEEAARPGWRAAVPRWRRGLEPAAAVWSRDLLPEIEAALLRGERSLRQVTGWRGVAIVDVEGAAARRALGGLDPARFFTNVNTPADVARLEKLLDSGGRAESP
jgi:molybdopterin-guanine dinucleotide biosynthesis protein A